MRILGTFARWLFILCLPVLLLTASIGWLANSLWLYQYGAHKYDIRQALSEAGLELTDAQLRQVYTELISYFNSREEYVSLIVTTDGQRFNLLTPEETIHFKDIKGLIRLDYWVLLGTLVYALGYAVTSLLWNKPRYWRTLVWGVVGGSSLTLALMLALGLGISFASSWLLLQFHYTFFSNLFWSAEGYQLLLFPEDFLYDAALFCALATAVMAIILGVVGGGYLWYTRRQK